MFLLRLKSQTIEDYGDVISYLCSYGIDNGPSILWARSDEIPTLDVRPMCRGIASQSADPGVGRSTFATKSLTTSVRLDGDE